MIKFFRQYGIFLLVPSVVLVYSILLKLAAGPYWLASNVDPSYAYLINGLRILKGFAPNHIDHPGTPLQMLCGVVCWLFNIGSPVSVIAKRVFISPEFYLHAVFFILSFLAFVTSFGLSVYVFRKTNDQLAAILTQLPALSFLVLKSWDTLEPVLPVVANVFPETFFISIINIFNLCLLKRYFLGTPKGGYGATMVWALVSGMAVAVKITFIPLLLLPLIILSWKNRIIFIAVFLVSFFAWTLPIVGFYSKLGSWIISILTHTNNITVGRVGPIGVHKYCLNLSAIIHGQWVFIILLLAAAALCVWKFVQHKWEWGTTCLLAIMMVVLIQFAVVANDPGMHYLLPGVGLFGALLVIFYLQGPFRYDLSRLFVGVLIIILILAGAWQAQVYYFKLANLTKDIRTFQEHVLEKYKGYLLLGYYRSSGQESALSFGDMYSGSWDELFQLYPESFIFDRLYMMGLRDFKGRVSSEDLLARYHRVLMEGGGDFDFSLTPYKVRLLEKGRFENLYLLIGTAEKDDLMFRGYVKSGTDDVQHGAYAQALTDYSKAIKLFSNSINPKYAEVYNNRGNVYNIQGNFPAAVSDYDKAIAINPNYADAYYDRGNLYDSHGNYNQALSDYNKSIAINPEFAAGYYVRAFTYYHLNEFDKALADVLKAQKMGYPVNPKFINMLNKGENKGDGHI